MPAKVDITGQRFGRLVVLGPADNRFTGKKRTFWETRCDCGNIKCVGTDPLRGGSTKSCGCLRSDPTADHVIKGVMTRQAKSKKRAEETLTIGRKSCSRRCCPKKNPQPLSEFCKSPVSADGYSSHCKHCKKDERLRKAFGISLSDKERLLAEQGGRCANRGCAKPISGRDAHLDHDHRTGEIRGVLCSFCNTSLGRMMDSPEVIRGLLDYAIKHRQLKLVKGGKS